MWSPRRPPHPRLPPLLPFRHRHRRLPLRLRLPNRPRLLLLRCPLLRLPNRPPRLRHQSPLLRLPNRPPRLRLLHRLRLHLLLSRRLPSRFRYRFPSAQGSGPGATADILAADTREVAPAADIQAAEGSPVVAATAASVVATVATAALGCPACTSKAETANCHLTFAHRSEERCN
jgi:hypothetical protein